MNTVDFRGCRLLEKFDYEEDSAKHKSRTARLFRAFQKRGNSEAVGEKLEDYEDEKPRTNQVAETQDKGELHFHKNTP